MNADADVCPSVSCPDLQMQFSQASYTEKLTLMTMFMQEMDDQDVVEFMSWKWRNSDFQFKFHTFISLILIDGFILTFVSVFFFLFVFYTFYKLFQFFRAKLSARNNVSDDPLLPNLDRVSLSSDPQELRFSPESQVAGSEIHPSTDAPKCQVKIYNNDGIHVGNGYRDWQNYLVTPAHVVHEFGSVSLRSIHGIRKTLLVSNFDIPIGIDLAFYKLADGDWADLGVSKAVYPDKYDFDTVVSVHSGSGFSTGYLDSTLNPEMVRYTGSTKPGFSGSVYAAGNKIFGMHLGGGAHNVGYPFPYIVYVLANFTYASEVAKAATTFKNGGIVPEKNKGKNRRNKRSRASDDSYIEYMLQDAKKKGKQIKVYRSYPAPQAPIYYYGRNRVVEVDDDFLNDPYLEIVEPSNQNRIRGELKILKEVLLGEGSDTFVDQPSTSKAFLGRVSTSQEDAELEKDLKELVQKANNIPKSALVPDTNLADVFPRNWQTSQEIMKFHKDQAIRMVSSLGHELTLVLKRNLLKDISKLEEQLSKVTAKLQPPNDQSP